MKHSMFQWICDRLSETLQRLPAEEPPKNGRTKKADAVGIESTALFGYVLSLVRFPFAQKCRHAVALDLLSIMEEHGVDLPEGLVEAICKSSEGDATAEEILLKSISPLTAPLRAAKTMPNDK